MLSAFQCFFEGVRGRIMEIRRARVSGLGIKRASYSNPCVSPPPEAV